MYNILTTPFPDYTEPHIEFSVVALSDTSVNITWYPPLQYSTCIMQYTIRGVSDNTNISISASGVTTYVLSGLSSGDTYNFNITGIDRRNIVRIYSQNIAINFSGVCIIL